MAPIRPRRLRPQRSERSIGGIDLSIEGIGPAIRQIETAIRQIGTEIGQIGTAIRQIGTEIGQIGTAIRQIRTAIGQIGTAIRQNGTAIGGIEGFIGAARRHDSGSAFRRAEKVRALIAEIPRLTPPGPKDAQRLASAASVSKAPRAPMP